MKNLELANYNVTEMNDAEIKETDGGFAWLLVSLIVIGVGILIGALTGGSTTIEGSGSVQIPL